MIDLVTDVLETRGRKGTFVARQHRELSDEDRLDYLRARTAELIRSAAVVGASETDVRKAVEIELAATPLLGA